MAGRVPVRPCRPDLRRDERDPTQRRRRATAGAPPMMFRLSSEQRDFAASLREMLAAADVPAAVRAWGAGDFGPGRKLWARLADLGLTSLGHADSGADAVDLVLAFEELGRAAVPGPYVESVAVLPRLIDIDPELSATLA